MDIICTYFCIFNQEDLHRGAFVQCKCMRVHWDLLSSETNKLTSRTLDSFERKRNKLKHAHPCDAPCGHHTFLSLFCLRSRSGKHLITPKNTVSFICTYVCYLAEKYTFDCSSTKHCDSSFLFQICSRACAISIDCLLRSHESYFKNQFGVLKTYVNPPITL